MFPQKSLEAQAHADVQKVAQRKSQTRKAEGWELSAAASRSICARRRGPDSSLLQPCRAVLGHNLPHKLSYPTGADVFSAGGSLITLLILLPQLSTCGYRPGEITAIPEDGLSRVPSAMRHSWCNSRTKALISLITIQDILD